MAATPFKYESIAYVSYSDVKGGWPGTGNIDADHLFVDPANGDLHLQAGSPAIDTGTNDGCPSTDFDGVIRPQDGNNDGTATCDMGAFEFLVTVIPITIDIKPGSNVNPINLTSTGVTPVAVLTTAEFDAANLDPATVTFARASPLRWVKKDIDWDGDMDLLFHFKTQALILNKSSTEASLVGKTFDGMSVEGTDRVKIVPTK